ncbi:MULTISPECIES: hypothetical protein [unclassified Anabaena]|uniref:hypothetical protein n=1 Tax=unclassified Anabaena TaxID=2619674 RepID=UPI002B220B80|nr:hypothetical protein [Anabaena sp. UHCC 0399]MEA5567729.1 hypothetical protein [Anabaena sp. UHCC 0399]
MVNIKLFLYNQVFQKVNPKIFIFIKIISIVVTTGAILLELWNDYLLINNQQILNHLNIILWIGRIVITTHFLEAVIATTYAPAKNRTPLHYGIYTFFVGTIGLLELFNQEELS